MENISLTYIIATRNKLPYLTEILKNLVVNKKDDEEIIVIDGGSTDGTAAYLKELFESKKIDQYVSEKDTGEAHAFNKGVLKARGELIKYVTDDDAFLYEEIATCKLFMLDHPEIDILSTDGAKKRPRSLYPFTPMLHEAKFKEYLRRGTPFASCGLGLMVRRTSLPLVGVFNTNYMRVDAEFTLRVTASKARMAWYTKECYVHIRNAQSNSFTAEQRMQKELETLEAVYLKKPLPARHLQALKLWIKKILKRDAGQARDIDKEVAFEEWCRLYAESILWLKENAKANGGQFLY